jgi:hypothetical protein
VVEQAARVRGFGGRARELLRNSLRWFSDRSGTMQLGLRFAAAKLPGLRTGRGRRSPVEPCAGPWWPEGAMRTRELCYHQPAGPL